MAVNGLSLFKCAAQVDEELARLKPGVAELGGRIALNVHDVQACNWRRMKLKGGGCKESLTSSGAFSGATVT